MANKDLFKSFRGKSTPAGDTRNRAGGTAYKRGPRQALAQMAVTGCLSNTFYASSQNQLEDMLDAASLCDPEFVAKAAIYARGENMKDAPALLLASLASRSAVEPGKTGDADQILSKEALCKSFSKVVDNGRVLRNFVQIVRSGVTGRKSFGSFPRRLIRDWLSRRTDNQLFRDSVGNDPSMADVIKMVRPKPETEARRQLFSYLIGKSVDREMLPFSVAHYEAFKLARSGKAGDDVEEPTLPDVPFQMLDSLNLTKSDWTEIARNAKWQMTKKNLNTFMRHGVLEDAAMVDMIAERLRNPTNIMKARVFPFDVLSAYVYAESMPRKIVEALHDAMEIAVSRVPSVGRAVILVDVSYSMSSPITGRQGRRKASKIRCIDAAALFGSAIMRKNPDSLLWAFSHNVVDPKIEPRDTIITNARKLADLLGGGTDTGHAMSVIHRRNPDVDLVILVSDNESWMDTEGKNINRGTDVVRHWNTFKAKRPNAKLVCIDITPNPTSQVLDRGDVLNIGGFSDGVFTTIDDFVKGNLSPDHFEGVIEAVSLDDEVDPESIPRTTSIS